MSAPKSLVEFPSDREIVSTREFVQPREEIFAAFSDPTRLAQWWGPNGFTNTIREFDLRPGGKWRLTMHGPDGANYDNESRFLEVVRPARIVFQHEEPVHGFRMTMTFAEHGAGTLLTWCMCFESAGEVAKIGEFIAVANQQNFDRLAAHLAGKLTQPFIITREFDAPRAVVWQAWAERERFTQWFGPKGFTTRVATMDFRAGGMLHYCQIAPDGKEIWGKAAYREIVSPEKLVWLNSFSDKDAGITRHPFSKDPWPLQMLTVVTFAENAGQTTVTVNWLPFDADEAELKTFDANRAGMNQGWGGTFERLEAYLAKR